MLHYSEELAEELEVVMALVPAWVPVLVVPAWVVPAWVVPVLAAAWLMALVMAWVPVLVAAWVWSTWEECPGTCRSSSDCGNH